MKTTLQGQRILLRPLEYADAAALLHAAADGELWNLTVTVVPSASTVDSYLTKALDGRDAGTVMPFVIVLKDTCLLYTSPSPRDGLLSRMPSSA